jgi:hypothetical protein
MSEQMTTRKASRESIPGWIPLFFLMIQTTILPVETLADTPGPSQTPPTEQAAMTQNQPHRQLAPKAFVFLPLGNIEPQGWLASQLRIQADGLSGHLDEFWPDIQNSGWIGGSAEGWERGPYWLDGLVPLAYLTSDSALKAKVEHWMDFILTHPYSDGWLGPNWEMGARLSEPKDYDMWPTFPLLKAMAQYQEATGDPRVIPAMVNHARRLSILLDEKPLFAWATYRWIDLNVVLFWLYERSGEPWLLDLALKAQIQGFDWQAHFAHFDITDKTNPLIKSLSTHGVNHGMGIKQPAVTYPLSYSEADRQAALSIFETLDRYHGQVTGTFTCDEHLAGKSPSQGTELCTVVESMYSLEQLVSTFGFPELADRLERITFNALPAPFKPDMWAHQYDQQANQVVCRISPDRVYTDNGPEANLFGLEPNYGCCTANFSQGWPKYASSLWMRSQEGGLAAISYAPCKVSTEVGGKRVRVDVSTDYPFSEEVRISVNAQATFPLMLRIPSWAEGATVQVGGIAAVPAANGTFHRIERKWSGDTVIRLKLPQHWKVERRFNQSASLIHGPLVFSLLVGESWKQVRGEAPHADWEVYPTTQWNYALALDPEHPENAICLDKKRVGNHPFSPEGAPYIVKVKGRLLPEWVLERNAAAPPPESPVHSDQPLEDLVLVPYGCTNLRVTEFPVLAPTKGR